MDTILLIGTVLLASVAGFFIWILVSDSRAMKRSKTTPADEIMASRQTSGSEANYDGADCFYDCMRAFHWEFKEESPCASACGLKP